MNSCKEIIDKLGNIARLFKDSKYLGKVIQPKFEYEPLFLIELGIKFHKIPDEKIIEVIIELEDDD